jgi:hypothetical protein
MTAINHSLTGALIGLTVANPLIAIPLAITSHFVLDTVPHFGYKYKDKRGIKLSFIVYLFVEAFLCAALVGLLVLNKPIHWPLAVICAFLAASPDFLSFNKFYKNLKGLPWKPGLYAKFASGIQWFERPIGAVIEAVWLASMIFCVSIFLHR